MHTCAAHAGGQRHWLAWQDSLWRTTFTWLQYSRLSLLLCMVDTVINTPDSAVATAMHVLLFYMHV